MTRASRVLPIPQISESFGRPVLSVICVVLRDPEGLLLTLRSLPSTTSRVEVVVVDGEGPSSASRTDEVVAEISRLGATVVSGRDSGPYDAMNRGILASTGQWLWFLNAGDERHPGLDVDRLLDELRSCQAAWAVGAVDLVDGTHVTVNRAATAHEILRGLASQPHQGVFVSRRGIAGAGLYDTRYRIAADYGLMCTLALADEPHQLDTTVATFYRGGLSTTMRRRLFLEFFLVRLRTRANGVAFTLRDFAWALKHATLSAKLPSASEQSEPVEA